MQRDHRRFRALALLLVLVLVAGLTSALPLFFGTSGTQADDTGWISPSSDAATGDGTGADGFEVNPTNAYTDNATSAENHGGLGDSHLFYNFGFNVPSGASVKGIQVRLDWYLDSDNGTNSMSVDMSWDGGSSWTSAATDNVETTAEHTAYLGSSSETWGRSWTPNELADGSFRVRITCNSDTTGRVFYLEYVSVIAYYAPVDHLEVTGTSAMTAGGSNALTITARDTLGDIAVNYSGTKSITFSGPGQAPDGQNPTVGGLTVGTPVSVAFTNGVSNAAAATLVAYRAESTTVDVSDGTIDSTGSAAYDLDLTVNAASASRLEVTGSATMIAGSTNELTVTAKDSYGNVDTYYSGSKSLTFSGPATAPGGQIPTVESVNIGSSTSVIFTGGVSNAAAATLIAYRAESTTVDVSDGTIDSTGSAAYDLDLTVNAASASRLEVTGSATMTAGSTNELAVTAKDSYGNVDTYYSGSKSLTFSGPATAPGGQIPTVESVNIGSSTSVAFTSGVSNAGSATLVAYTAQSTTVDVSDGTIGSTGSAAYDLDLTVNAAAAATLDLTPNGGSTTAGSPFSVAVTAYDSYGNIATGYLGTVHFASSDLNASLPADYTFSAPDSGSHTFAVSLGTSGSQTITVTDTGNAALTDTESWIVGATSIHHYTVISDNYTQTAGVPFTVTVTAYDSLGNPVSSDNSTSVTMTSSSGTLLFDSNANGTFGEASDNVMVLSSGTFNINARDTMAHAGITITATDGSAKTGTSSAYTIAAGAIDHYTVTSTSYVQTAGSPFIVTVTACDSSGNTVTTDNSPSITMTSSSGTLLFDGNNNGVFGEATDNVMVLSSGAFNIVSRDTVANTGVTITATDGSSRTGTSSAYTFAAAASIDHYTVTSVSYNQTAGVAFTVTVNACDSLGNTVTTDNSTSVTMTSSSATMLFDGNGNGTFGEVGDNAVVLSSGTFNISARDNTAGTGVTITATGGSASGISSAYTIAAGVIDHYTVTSVSYNQTAGVAFTVTVNACDSLGNTVTTDNSTSVTMTSSSATMLFDGNGNGTFGEVGDNAVVLSSGTFNISARDNTAGTGVTITATDGSSMTGTSSAYTIGGGVTHHYDVTSVSYSQTAGDAFTITVVAHDEFHNLVDDSTTSVTMTSSSGTMLFDANGDGTYGDASQTLTNGTFNITARDTTAATGVTITATGSSATGISSAYTIAAGPLHHYEATSSSYSQTAGVAFTVTVTAHDEFHNLVDDSTTSVTMTSNSATMAFDANDDGTYGDASQTLTNGTFNITARDSEVHADIAITATDGNSITGTSSSYTISAGSIDHYTVTSDDYTQETTVAFTVTVTAYDSLGNLVPADNVTVTMSSTSSGLVFDGNGNGTFGEAGDDVGVLVAGTFDIRGKFKSTAESVTITATDADLKAGYSEPYTVEDFRCFIATAAYGTPMTDQIQVLRDFRDQYLMKTPAGRWFVSTYYKYSPPLARFIAHHDSLRALVRFVLTPVIWLTTLFMNTTLLEKMALLASILAVVAAAVFWLRRLRQSPTA